MTRLLSGLAACALLAAAAPAVAAPAPPAAGAAGETAARAPLAPMRVALDASRAGERIYTIAVTMPAAPGPFTFVYPKWIPGYHGPVGPIEDLVSLHVAAGGSPVAWRRDTSDQYAVHVTVPPGASSVEADFQVVAAPSHDGMLAIESTPALAILEFSSFVVYPDGAPALDQPVDATVTLPAGWNFGTALPVRARSGDTVTFDRVPLYELVDSPVLAGRNYRAVPLGTGHEIDVVADGPEATALSPAFVRGMRRLVAEGPALYGGRHYRDYHFLLTLSDAIEPEGIEHHESSDDRTVEAYGREADALRTGSDLLAHEYSHSWNGKYRRPADLFAPTYQTVEQTDLLWVYEGLNQYNGEKLATRAGLTTLADERDKLAETAAYLDAESGRLWRPIQDTADAAPILYEAPGRWSDLRRTAGDFYREGDLIWLEADVRIRALTHGARSLDDFCRLFAGGSRPPSVRGYDEAEIVATLDRVAHDDWAGFFAKRIAAVSARAPLGGIRGGGWLLAFEPTPSPLEAVQDARRHTLDARYSLGLSVHTEGAEAGVVDAVLAKGPAFAAGLQPGAKIVAVDGRAFTPDVLRAAIRTHKGSTAPITLMTVVDGFYATVAFAAPTGERYPRLERVPGAPDVLARIYAPHAAAGRTEGAR